MTDKEQLMGDDYRPMRHWPLWMLQALIAMRRRKTMWTDAYLELIDRGHDAAAAHAARTGAHVVVAPRGLQ